MAAVLVTVLSIPQGLAYAMMAGLPPAVGLYASMLPAILGGLFRSSRHVVAGPTNALSLLVGGALAVVAAKTGAAPVELALTLALLVGVIQLAAGVLRLGSLVDYISDPVVLGYITGAGVLIGVGQLPHLTGVPVHGESEIGRLVSWFGTLGDAHPIPVALGLGTTAGIVLLRWLSPRIPGALVAMGVGIAVSMIFDLPGRGVTTIGDLAPVPASLPPFGLPPVDNVRALLPSAVAVAVLSLVESSAVARALAGRTGDRVDASVEFAGQGLANLVSAVSGGYPVSGSLGRSMANWRAGARTRLAGMLGGVFVLLVVLLAGPIVDYTPTSSLAGLLLVLAWDLVDRSRIVLTLKSGIGDVAAFLATLVGAWTLELDQAIYLGVGLSVVMFLRRARQLTVRELVVDGAGRLREATTAIASEDDELPEPEEGYDVCPQIRILHVEGSLFFGAAGELGAALDTALADPEIAVLVVRLKRCQGLDVTTAEILRAAALRMRQEGRHLVLVGMRPPVMERMRALGLVEVVGEAQVFPTQPGWFVAMDRALYRSIELVHGHFDHAHCPIEDYLALRRKLTGIGGPQG